MRVDPVGVRAEQPRELSRVRGQHGRGRTLDRLELEQASASTTAGRSMRSSSSRTSARRPSPRPSPGPSASAPARSAAATIVRSARPVLPPDLDRLQSERLDDRERLRGHGERDVTGIGAKGGTRGERRGAGHPRLPADDEHACRVLRVPLAAERDEREQLRRGSTDVRRDVLEADVRDDDPARVEAAGRDDQPDLGRVEGDGEIRVHGGAGDLPRRRVDARRRSTATTGAGASLMRSISSAAPGAAPR